MIHLLCIVDGPPAGGGRDSRESAEIVVPLGSGLACVGRPCGGSPPEPEPDALVRHDRLVQDWMQVCGGALPFRYGTVAEDRSAVSAALEPYHREFRRLLRQVKGRVELALRVDPGSKSTLSQRSAEEGAGTPGRSYLRYLESAGPGPQLKMLHRSLAQLAAASVAEPTVVGGIKASYLVEPGAIEEFRRRLERAVTETKGLGPVSLTGPWPPYTFAASLHGSLPLVTTEAATGGKRG